MIPRDILKKIRQIELRTNRLVSESLAGQYHSVFKGQGMNFEEVREYQPGDEVRTIDWNVTARMNHPFVKKFVEERELTLMLVVDVSGSGLFGSREQSKRELAAEIASVLAFSAIRNNDKVGLILFTDTIEKYIPPRKGRRHVLRVIREVLFYEPKRRGTDLNQALEFLLRVTPHKAIAAIVSDFIGAPALRRSGKRQIRPQLMLLESLAQASFTMLKQANRRHDVVAVQITDPYELELPSLGRLVLEDAETGEIVEVSTGDERKREAFAQRQARAQADLTRLFRTAGIDSIQLRTDQSYTVALGRFFQGAGEAEVARMITNAPAQSLSSSTNGLHDIRPPVIIPDAWLLVWLAAGALAAVGLAFLIWWLWQRNRKETLIVPIIPPHILARQKLEEALGYIAQPKPFCILVSKTIRVYLEERFEFRAPERTTEEFLHELRDTDRLSPDQKESLGEFLKRCDLVKFARYEPREAELRELHAAALRLVEETEPLPEPVGAPAASDPESQFTAAR